MKRKAILVIGSVAPRFTVREIAKSIFTQNVSVLSRAWLQENEHIALEGFQIKEEVSQIYKYRNSSCSYK